MYSSVALLLLAAVAGYWVLERAVSHRGQLQKVGQVLGAIVIVISLIGVACKVWYLTTGQAGYHKMGGRYHHQMMQQAPAQTTR